MFSIYQNRGRNNGQLLIEVVKELDWNLNLNRKIGSKMNMIMFKRMIEMYLSL